MPNNAVQTISLTNLPLPRTAGEEDLFNLVKTVAAVGTVLGIGYLLLYFSNNQHLVKR